MYQFKLAKGLYKDITALLTLIAKHLLIHKQLLAEIVLWQRGVWLLLGLERFHVVIGKWGPRFKLLGVCSASYSLQHFQRSGAIYVMLSAGRRHFYIGSTTTSMFTRHGTRKSKLAQLSRGQWVSCELAVHFWAKSQTFHYFIPIVYRTFTNKLDLLAQEYTDIQNWQPPLNFPFVCKLVKGMVQSFKITSVSVGRKLFARYRELSLNQRNATGAWLDLCKLGSLTGHSYTTARRLRGRSTPSSYLYALYSLATHLGEPARTKATQALSLVFKFRKLQWPSSPRPLVVPFLAQANFGKDLHTLLMNIIQRAGQANKLLPLHWPSAKVLEGAPRRISDLLYNWRHYTAEARRGDAPVCCCQDVIKRLPSLAKLKMRGHIAGDLQTVSLPASLSFLQNIGSDDTFFMGREEYFLFFHACLKKWNRQLHDTFASEFEAFIEAAWISHSVTLSNHNYLEAKLLNSLKALLKGLVVHNADHHAYRICVFCPVIYHNMLSATFEDQSVFLPHGLPPSHLRQLLPSLVPNNLKTRYAWGWNWKRDIPGSYILPKDKKMYKNGRPVICYRNTCLSRITQALGHILNDLLKKVVPSSFGLLTIQQTFKSIHKYLSNAQSVASAQIFNDDLKGFFTSVPHSRIRMAIQFLISWYLKAEPGRLLPEDIILTVDTSGKPGSRIIRGKGLRTSTQSRQLYLMDIGDLVAVALRCSFFQALSHTFIQIRGACVGNPAAGSICSVTVSIDEHMWVSSFNFYLSNAYINRYVDNRLIIIDKCFISTPAIMTLLDLNFYMAPVELEACGSYTYLGFEINVAARTCHYILPPHPAQYRSAFSAGSTKLKLSGLRSRLHLLYSGTFPPRDARNIACGLLNMYLTKGFTLMDLEIIHSLVRAKFQNKLTLSHGFYAHLTNCKS